MLPMNEILLIPLPSFCVKYVIASKQYILKGAEIFVNAINICFVIAEK